MKSVKNDTIISLISYKQSLLCKAISCLLIFTFSLSSLTYAHEDTSTLRRARDIENFGARTSTQDALTGNADTESSSTDTPLPARTSTTTKESCLSDIIQQIEAEGDEDIADLLSSVTSHDDLAYIISGLNKFMQASDNILHHARAYLTTGYIQGELLGYPQLAEGCDSLAFGKIQKGVSESVSSHIETPKITKLRKGAAVKVTAPIRLEISSGCGSDLLPISLEKGGRAINIALQLRGKRPIEVAVKHIEERVIKIRSVDLKQEETISDIDSLNYTKPNAKLTLVKAALYETGIIPEETVKSLSEILDDLGGGLEIVTNSQDIPMGSGLGVSSILGAAVITGLLSVADQPASKEKALCHTLNLEQRMGVGGGWQDIVGGLFGGIKCIDAIPGNPVPTHNELKLPGGSLARLKDRLVLLYTGKGHHSGDILSEIIRNYLLRRKLPFQGMLRARNASNSLVDAFQAGNIDDLGTGLSNAWGEYKTVIGPSVTSVFIEDVFESVDDIVSGGRLSGSGGGGFMLLIAKEGKTEDLKTKLRELSEGTEAEIYDYEIDDEGIRVEEIAPTDTPTPARTSTIDENDDGKENPYASPSANNAAEDEEEDFDETMRRMAEDHLRNADAQTHRDITINSFDRLGIFVIDYPKVEGRLYQVLRPAFIALLDWAPEFSPRFNWAYEMYLRWDDAKRDLTAGSFASFLRKEPEDLYVQRITKTYTHLRENALVIMKAIGEGNFDRAIACLPPHEHEWAHKWAQREFSVWTIDNFGLVNMKRMPGDYLEQPTAAAYLRKNAPDGTSEDFLANPHPGVILPILAQAFSSSETGDADRRIARQLLLLLTDGYDNPLARYLYLSVKLAENESLDSFMVYGLPHRQIGDAAGFQVPVSVFDAVTSLLYEDLLKFLEEIASLARYDDAAIRANLLTLLNNQEHGWNWRCRQDIYRYFTSNERRKDIEWYGEFIFETILQVVRQQTDRSPAITNQAQEDGNELMQAFARALDTSVEAKDVAELHAPGLWNPDAIAQRLAGRDIDDALNVIKYLNMRRGEREEAVNLGTLAASLRKIETRHRKEKEQPIETKVRKRPKQGIGKALSLQTTLLYMLPVIITIARFLLSTEFMQTAMADAIGGDPSGWVSIVGFVIVLSVFSSITSLYADFYITSSLFHFISARQSGETEQLKHLSHWFNRWYAQKRNISELYSDILSPDGHIRRSVNTNYLRGRRAMSLCAELTENQDPEASVFGSLALSAGFYGNNVWLYGQTTTNIDNILANIEERDPAVLEDETYSQLRKLIERSIGGHYWSEFSEAQSEGFVGQDARELFIWAVDGAREVLSTLTAIKEVTDTGIAVIEPDELAEIKSWTESQTLRTERYIHAVDTALERLNSLSDGNPITNAAPAVQGRTATTSAQNDSREIHQRVTRQLLNHINIVKMAFLEEKHKLQARIWTEENISLEKLIEDNPELRSLWKTIFSCFKVRRYAAMPAETAEPIVITIDEDGKSRILDGVRRAKAAKRRGDDNTPAYVGRLPKALDSEPAAASSKPTARTAAIELAAGTLSQQDANIVFERNAAAGRWLFRRGTIDLQIHQGLCNQLGKSLAREKTEAALLSLRGNDATSIVSAVREILEEGVDFREAFLSQGIGCFYEFNRVLLVAPFGDEQGNALQYATPHRGLELIAYRLRRETDATDVIVYNPNLTSRETLYGFVRTRRFDIIGFSIMQTILGANLEIMGRLALLSPDSIFIAGGNELSTFPRKEVFASWPVDILAFDNGGSIVEIVGRLTKTDDKTKTLLAMNNIPAITTRLSLDNAVSKPKREKPAIPEGLEDDIPFDVPDLIHQRTYDKPQDTTEIPTYWNVIGKRPARIHYSDTCKGKCIFCGTTRNTQGPLDPEVVMHLISEESGSIHFESADFFSTPPKVMELLESLMADPTTRRVPKLAVARVDHATKGGLLERCAEAGFRIVAYGIESFDDRVLREIGKETTAQQNIEAIEYTINAGMKPGINLMAYTPWDTIKTSLKNVRHSLHYLERGAYVNVVPYINAGFGRPISEKPKFIEYETYNYPGLKKPFKFPRRGKILDRKLAKVADRATEILYFLTTDNDYPAWANGSATIYGILVFKSFLMALQELNTGVPDDIHALTAETEEAIQRVLRAEGSTMKEKTHPEAMGVVETHADPYNSIVAVARIRTEEGRDFLLRFMDNNPHIPSPKRLPYTMVYNIELLDIPEQKDLGTYKGWVKIETDGKDDILSHGIKFRRVHQSDIFIHRAITDFLIDAEDDPHGVLLDEDADYRKIDPEGTRPLGFVSQAHKEAGTTAHTRTATVINNAAAQNPYQDALLAEIEANVEITRRKETIGRSNYFYEQVPLVVTKTMYADEISKLSQQTSVLQVPQDTAIITKRIALLKKIFVTRYEESRFLRRAISAHEITLQLQKAVLQRKLYGEGLPYGIPSQEVIYDMLLSAEDAHTFRRSDRRDMIELSVFACNDELKVKGGYKHFTLVDPSVIYPESHTGICVYGGYVARSKEPDLQLDYDHIRGPSAAQYRSLAYPDPRNFIFYEKEKLRSENIVSTLAQFAAALESDGIRGVRVFEHPQIYKNLRAGAGHFLHDIVYLSVGITFPEDQADLVVKRLEGLLEETDLLEKPFIAPAATTTDEADTILPARTATGETDDNLNMENFPIFLMVRAWLLHNHFPEDVENIIRTYKLDMRSWTKERIPVKTLIDDNPGLPAWGEGAIQDVEAYAEMPADTAPPVVVVIEPDGTYKLLDGGRRTNAAKKRGDVTIVAYVGRFPSDATISTPPARTATSDAENVLDYRVRELKPNVPFGPFEKRHIAIGDTHGMNPLELKKALMTAEFINNRDEIIAKDTVLVMTGDMIDGREYSLALYEYIRTLRQSALQGEDRHGCRVVTLLGNHEEMLYCGMAFSNDTSDEFIDRWIANLALEKDPEALEIVMEDDLRGEELRDEIRAHDDWFKLYNYLKEDVDSGYLQAAYEYGGALFLHGGVTKDFVKKRSAAEVASELNGYLDRYRETGIYNDGLHQAFWNKFEREVDGSGIDFLQVVGHGILPGGMVTLSEMNGNVIDLDVNGDKIRSYLEIAGSAARGIDIIRPEDEEIRRLLAEFRKERRGGRTATVADDKTLKYLEFRNSIGGLKTAAEAELETMLTEAPYIHDNTLTSQAIVLQAEAVLDKCAVVDLHETLEKTKLVDRVVIYTEKDDMAEARILERLVEEANSGLKVSVHSQAEIAKQKPNITGTATQQVESLVDYLMLDGIISNKGELLGFIRQTVKKPERDDLETRLERLKVPVIEIESSPDEHVYSFEQALKLARAMKTGEIESWLEKLPPINPVDITEAIRQAYRKYQGSLEALRAL